MKTSEAGFRFPVLGFTPEPQIWAFPDMDTLTSCGPRTLKDNLQIGMELVDADGRRWIVRSVTRIGRAKPWLTSVVELLMYAKMQSRIEHELDALEPLSLDEVKARACAMVEAFPEDYGHYVESDNLLAPMLAEVHAAKDIASLPDLLGLDSFKSY